MRNLTKAESLTHETHLPTQNVGVLAPSESTRSFTQEGYLKCVNVRLAKAPQVRQYYAYEFPNLEGYSADQVIN
ncbi:hypothetical protein DBB30_26775, partial [Yersinia pestis]